MSPSCKLLTKALEESKQSKPIELKHKNTHTFQYSSIDMRKQFDIRFYHVRTEAVTSDE